jgi:hypothetical protein
MGERKRDEAAPLPTTPHFDIAQQLRQQQEQQQRMEDSPSAATLRSLLRTTSSPSSPNTDTSRCPRTPSPRSSRPSSTVKPSTAVGGWGDTFSNAFAYTATTTGGGAGAGRGVKGKARAGIPLWEAQDGDSTAEEVDGQRRLSGTSESYTAIVNEGEKGRQDGADDELDELAESILWQVRLQAPLFLSVSLLSAKSKYVLFLHRTSLISLLCRRALTTATLPDPYSSSPVLVFLLLPPSLTPTFLPSSDIVSKRSPRAGLTQSYAHLLTCTAPLRSA